jgi:quinol monooxygenase YgiN
LSVVVVATIIPRPEHRDEVLATITETVATVHEELSGPAEVIVLRAVPAGDQAKGQL